MAPWTPIIHSGYWRFILILFFTILLYSTWPFLLQFGQTFSLVSHSLHILSGILLTVKNEIVTVMFGWGNVSIIHSGSLINFRYFHAETNLFARIFFTYSIFQGIKYKYLLKKLRCRKNFLLMGGGFQFYLTHVYRCIHISTNLSIYLSVIFIYISVSFFLFIYNCPRWHLFPFPVCRREEYGDGVGRLHDVGLLTSVEISLRHVCHVGPVLLCNDDILIRKDDALTFLAKFQSLNFWRIFRSKKIGSPLFIAITRVL